MLVLHIILTLDKKYCPDSVQDTDLVHQPCAQSTQDTDIMHESSAVIVQDADIVHQYYTDSVQVMEPVLDLDQHNRTSRQTTSRSSALHPGQHSHGLVLASCRGSVFWSLGGPK